MNNTRKVSLYEICLIALLFIYELKKIYLFQNLNGFLSISQYVEIVIYLLLFIIIINKSYSKKQFFIIGILIIIFGIGFVQTGNAIFLRGLLIIVAGKDIEYQRIITVCMKVILVTFTFTVFLYLLGLSNVSGFRRNGIALGYIHPNQAAQVVMMLSLMWLTTKSFKVTKGQIFLILVSNTIITIITGSRTPFIILIITPILIYIIRKNMIKNGRVYKITIFAQIFLLIITVWSGLMYFQSKLIIYLDQNYFKQLNTLTGRIFLNWHAFMTYGVSMFGKKVDFTATQYTLDNSYALSLITMGIIPTILFMIGYFVIISKSIKTRNYVIIAVAVALSIYGFSEASMLDVLNNFVYLSILSKPILILSEDTKK